jgi:FMN reductase
MKIVGIGGTLRDGSSTERLVAAVLAACASMGAQTQMFGAAP